MHGSDCCTYPLPRLGGGFGTAQQRIGPAPFAVWFPVLPVSTPRSPRCPAALLAESGQDGGGERGQLLRLRGGERERLQVGARRPEGASVRVLLTTIQVGDSSGERWKEWNGFIPLFLGTPIQRCPVSPKGGVERSLGPWWALWAQGAWQWGLGHRQPKPALPFGLTHVAHRMSGRLRTHTICAVACRPTAMQPGEEGKKLEVGSCL